jgi:hypothetical protein
MFPFGEHGSFQQIWTERDVILATVMLLIAPGTEIYNIKCIKEVDR